MTTSHYALDRWQRQVWTSDTRVYIIELKQNLFGDWILTCAWRGKGQRGGQSQTRYAASYEEALDGWPTPSAADVHAAIGFKYRNLIHEFTDHFNGRGASVNEAVGARSSLA